MLRVPETMIGKTPTNDVKLVGDISREERAASKARMDAANQEASCALQNNRCPDCGNGVYQNNALHGWVQCHGFPSKGFRRPGHENDKQCGWQGFTGDSSMKAKDVQPVGDDDDDTAELAARIKQLVKELKKDGTTNMSAANLKQLVNTRGLRFANPYHFSQEFAEALKQAGGLF
jgi:hypothetical protein